MKKYKIIANPAAGRGRSRAIVLKVVELLKQKGVLFDLELTRAPKDAATIARNALKEFAGVAPLSLGAAQDPGPL